MTCGRLIRLMGNVPALTEINSIATVHRQDGRTLLFENLKEIFFSNTWALEMVCQHRDLVTFCSSQMFYLVKFATSHERQTKLFLFHVEIITKLHIAKPHRRLYHVAGNLALFAKRLDVGFARLIERIPGWLRCWH